MAIQPPYAQAILDGSKQVEFRKRRLAADVDTVLIYESAPTKRIVGHFTIDRTELASPSRLWSSLGSVGFIAHADYLAYYANSESAVGLVIGRVERYKQPVSLAQLSARPAVPQSFIYLPYTALSEVQSFQVVADWASMDQVLYLATALLRPVAELGRRGVSAIAEVAKPRSIMRETEKPCTTSR